MSTETDDPRERLRRQALAHVRGGALAAHRSQVRRLPNGIRVAGRPSSWEQLAERAQAAQRFNEPSGDLALIDPDEIGAENEALGTPDAVSVARQH
jgi:hypothetical protein